MSTTARTDAVPRGSRSVFAFWLKFAGLAGVVLLGLAASVGTCQSPAPKPSDDVLQLRVQSALDNDSELKPHKLNVLVNVVDRLAVIGGPVSDVRLAARLEAVAKEVPGIAGVKVSVWVPRSLVPDDPLSRKVAELMKSEPVRPTPAATLPVMAMPAAAPPAGPPPPTDPRPRGTTTSKKGPDGLLLDPVAPTGTGFRPPSVAPGAAPLPYETIPPPNVPPMPPRTDPPAFSPVDVPAEPSVKGPAGLEELRRDSRFAGLTVEIADGVAVIAGRANGGRERCWELAQAVRKLPGVTRVVVRQP